MAFVVAVRPCPPLSVIRRVYVPGLPLVRRPVRYVISPSSCNHNGDMIVILLCLLRSSCVGVRQGRMRTWSLRYWRGKHSTMRSRCARMLLRAVILSMHTSMAIYMITASCSSVVEHPYRRRNSSPCALSAASLPLRSARSSTSHQSLFAVQ